MPQFHVVDNDIDSLAPDKSRDVQCRKAHPFIFEVNSVWVIPLNAIAKHRQVEVVTCNKLAQEAIYRNAVVWNVTSVD